MTQQLTLLALICFVSPLMAEEPADIIPIWPASPPGPERILNGPEKDITGPDGRNVAGQPVIRLGNVAIPQAHVYRPAKDKHNGSAVIVCPGGGFNILAWDLEGTEVAEWLNRQGITAVVLKYRVPSRAIEPKWLLPVQDAQRTISIVRSRAQEWNLNQQRIGILGFSAGGHTAVRAALATERLYESVDESDQASFRPDAALLIYPAYLADDTQLKLIDGLKVPKNAPPAFMVHAWDDRISANGPMLLACAMKVAGAEAEVHVYDAGGHGYGLRPNPALPITSWPARAEDWFQRRGWLNP